MLSRLRAVVALAVAVTAMLVPVAAHAQGYYPGPKLGTDTSSHKAHLALRADGTAAGAWLEGVAAGNAPMDLYAQTLFGGVVTGAPVKLDTIVSPGNGFNPNNTSVAAATGPGGTGAVAWAYPTSSNSGVVKFARIGAGGTAGTVTLEAVPTAPYVVLGVDDRGVAVVAYTDGTHMRAARIAPNGAPTLMDLGPADTNTVPAAGVAPDGTAWVAWTTATDVQVVRLGADGTVASGPSVAVTPSPVLLALAVAPDGSGAVVGGVGNDQAGTRFDGARLGAAGPVVAGALHGAPIPGSVPLLPSLALSPDGTVTTARSWVFGVGGLESAVERYAPGDPSGVRIPGPFDLPAGALAYVPAVAAAPDGRVLLAWGVGADANATTLTLQARTIAADGTFGPIAGGGAMGAPFEFATTLPSSGLRPMLGADGGATVGVQERSTGSPDYDSMSLRLLDAEPPSIDVAVPAEAQVGTAVTLVQTPTDPRGVGAQSWDFGDGSRATGATVTHVYGTPGTYTVTARATDGFGNAGEVTRQVRITAPPGPPAVVPPPPAIAAPKPLAAAGLKISKAIRDKRKLTVTGTIAKSAGGKVTIAFQVRLNGALITQRKAATIKAGRWSATLTLSSTVLKARKPPVVLVTYAGDADTRAGTARSTVVKAKAKPKKKTKR